MWASAFLAVLLMLSGCANDCKRFKDGLWKLRAESQSDPYCVGHYLTTVDCVMKNETQISWQKACKKANMKEYID